MMMATTQSTPGQSAAQATRDQIREQVRAQVNEQVREAQARVRAAQAEIDAAQAAARATARAEQVVTPPLPPLPPMPPMPAMPPMGQGPGDPVIVVPSGPFGPADIPPRAQEVVMLFFVTMAIIVIGLPIARAISRWIDRRSNAPAIKTSDIQPHLVRIEQAVEAMAIEVERISEAQRYLTKLQTGAQAEPLLVPRSQRD